MKAGINPAWIFLALLLLAIYFAISLLFPMRVTAATAAPNEFSAERALAHLPIIAREPHPSGSAAQANVRDYLVQQLTNLGLKVETQKFSGTENVLARLDGSDSGGAVLLQAHYDSYGGPGAADNGSGVAALLEIARALSAGAQFKNDFIFLFDDGEELPDAFTGTKAFIRKHPWMADVRVAIGMDTAVHGFISIVDTGPKNGWIVEVLSQVHPVGVWTSLSGGGGYDTQPFRDAGIRVLEFEDNYPFYEQHTKDDIPDLVNPGSVQQLGDQVLAVAAILGDKSLHNTSGEQQTFIYVPLIGLFHYPVTWALPLAILAGVLLLVTIVMAFRLQIVSWRGLGVTFAAVIGLVILAVICTTLLWKAVPDLFGWQTQKWSEWPEVIPPDGWWIFIILNLVFLMLAILMYWWIRRWSTRISFPIIGFLLFLILALGVAVSEPRGAIFFTWPVIVGSIGWMAALILDKKGPKWVVDLCVFIAVLPTIIYLLPLMPSVFMSDGTKSVSVTAGALIIIWTILLPVIDDLFIFTGLKRQKPITPVVENGHDAMIHSSSG